MDNFIELLDQHNKKMIINADIITIVSSEGDGCKISLTAAVDGSKYHVMTSYSIEKMKEILIKTPPVLTKKRLEL